MHARLMKPSTWQRANGETDAYNLGPESSAAACELAGCNEHGQDPFAAGNGLYAMHSGRVGGAVVLAAAPPTVVGPRRGGTDAANAATWRLTPRPAHGAPAGSGAMYLEV